MDNTVPIPGDDPEMNVGVGLRRVEAVNATDEISDAVLTRSSDVHDGKILEQRGKLDEALVVYRRCIEACNATFATFANGRANNRAIDDRNAAVDKIGHRR